MEDRQLSEWWDGEWWCPWAKYAFNLITEDRRGYATITNAPRIFQPGDCTVKIDRIDQRGFSGEGIYTDGRWYKIQIQRISENELVWSPAWANGAGSARMSRRRTTASGELTGSNTTSQDERIQRSTRDLLPEMSGWRRRAFDSPGLTQTPPGPHVAKLAKRWSRKS
jgi:hypothetical protein